MSFSRERLKFSNYLINDNTDDLKLFQNDYKNYRNFTRFTKKINFDNEFNFGKICTSKLHTNGLYGDLITNIILQFRLPTISNPEITTTNNLNVTYTNSIGFSLFNFIEFKIGGNLIDRHTPEIMDILSELLTTEEKEVKSIY